MEFRSHPTDADWIALQRGYPTLINQNAQIVDIIHDYLGGDGMIVPTRKPIGRMGTINYEINGDLVTFPVELVRALHGEPCEARSITNGGHGYDRVLIPNI